MKKSIAEIHDELYMHLRTNYPDVRFGVRSADSPQKLCNGIWFIGNETGFYIPFWNGLDAKYNIYHIGWQITLQSDHDETPFIHLFISGQDNSQHIAYFEKLALFVNKSTNISLYKNDETFGWISKLENDLALTENFTKALDNFIIKIFPVINEFIKNNPFLDENSTVIEDYFTITEGQFIKNIDNIAYYRNKILYLEENKNNPNQLKYVLSGFGVRNYRGIKNNQIDDLPLNAQWIFLTGNNGFGKTSILKGIAIGLQQTIDIDYSGYDIAVMFLGYDRKNEKNKFLVQVKSTNIERQLDAIIEEKVNNYANELDEDNDDVNKYKEVVSKQLKQEYDLKYLYPDSDTIPPLATYGTTRNIGNEDDAAKIKPTDPLFKQNVPLYSIERELKDTEGRIPERYKILREALLHVIPNLHDVRVEVVDNSVRVVYIEKNDEGVPYYDTPLTLAELGDGMRGIISMVGDMVIRLEKQNPKGTALHDLEGFVLIDEIDANLHPKYQYEFPALLSKLLPKVQFIAITHSPIPLLGAPRGRTAVITVNRDIENGITAKLWDGAEIHKLSPNALLTSPIFGVEKLYGRDVTADEMESADDYTEIMDEETMIKNIAAMREQGLL